MSLARAFTKRMKRFEEPTSPRANRGYAARHGAGTIDVSKISSPITLLSTTNVHALNAPDIHKPTTDSATSSSASTHSGHDSDFSTIDRSFLTTTTASGEDSPGPGTPSTPPMEHSAGFFDVKAVDAPKLPQRSPSHSKRAHVELSRQRSIQRMPPVSLTRAASVRDTATMFTANVEQEAVSAVGPHPFGAELAQVNEVAEEFGAGPAVMDDEEQVMRNKGLHKYGVQDYIDEIATLYGGVFEDQLGRVANPWI